MSGVILLTGTSLYVVARQLQDPHARAEFSLPQCLTFATSGITFVRRWSVTPSVLSGRIVFITILATGLLTQAMWKAGLTSALAITKTATPYSGLEALLAAGILPCVEKATAEMANFRDAKEGAFKEAWDSMKGDEDQHTFISRPGRSQGPALQSPPSLSPSIRLSVTLFLPGHSRRRHAQTVRDRG